MRYAATLREMVEEGADLDLFFKPWDYGTKDYTELGLPQQGLAIKLKNKAVIEKKGLKLHYGKYTTRRTLWGKGCNYSAMKAYYLEKWLKTHEPNASCLQCGQEMPIPTAQ